MARRGTKRNPLPWAEFASAIVAGIGSGLGYEVSSRVAKVYDNKRGARKIYEEEEEVGYGPGDDEVGYGPRPIKKTAAIAKKMVTRKNPSVSQSQKSLFAAALKYKLGKTTKGTQVVKSLARQMTEKKLREFAETGGTPCPSRKNPRSKKRWAQEVDAEMEAKGTVGSLTRIAKARGYDSALEFARIVMKNWRAGKKSVYNRKTRKQSRVTQKVMYKALFAVNMNKGRRVKKNPKIVVVNPKNKSILAEAERKLKRKLTAAEKRSLAKAIKEYKEFHGVAPSGGTMVRVPKGTPKILVGIGQATQTNYKVGSEFGSSWRNGLWTHAAGDHGRKGKKTKPPYLAWAPGKKSVPLFAQAKGSNLYFKPTHGIVG